MRTRRMLETSRRALTKPTLSEVEMAESRICSVEGCGKPVQAKGWCFPHYMRWYRHGDPLGSADRRRKARLFLDEVVLKHDSDSCLVWPFSAVKGYGQIRIKGQAKLVNRIVCETVHGAPPSPEHHAAHSCNRGGDGCCSPKHLRWATPAENVADAIADGVFPIGERNGASKLTRDDVLEIRKLSSNTMSQYAIARKFNVGQQTIGKILTGKNWSWLK